MGQALVPVVPHMQRFGNHNLFEVKRQTLFFTYKMQTSYLHHLACNNTPSWPIKFYGQLYIMRYINLRRMMLQGYTVSAIFSY